MFTGLIEACGEVISNTQNQAANRLLVKSSFERLQTGESIAVNGVCLTLLPTEGNYLAFDVSPETLALTTLGQLQQGELVNLERAMPASARFGGHYVSGHVDTTAFLKSTEVIGEYLKITVGDFVVCAKMYLLPKGSITLDGVSLTINKVMENEIELMLVPHTLEKTTLGHLSIGQRLNVEFDYLTRIVAHQLKIAGQLNKEVEV
ncbi:riboflavin synthase [Legionella jamestowniensis]|uniref:Riboflavin synthase n=1 Tax=Legionella jamestowniensis TaxID=455 RepID=A0A0W0UGZ1_9GAMM|nr:riboflavin synthase [Legionella jamestowniensis]KTD06909.1 riboflavin synthase alpha chain [Legionella jamestowniensis]OCH97433.1 riboflavin synthase subunit alpha [Legionella jamestowniensis]SFL85268.1 riboflavin synthase alpha chain [Legionella jamestowniensis DSM 19215]